MSFQKLDKTLLKFQGDLKLKKDGLATQLEEVDSGYDGEGTYEYAVRTSLHFPVVVIWKLFGIRFR